MIYHVSAFWISEEISVATNYFFSEQLSEMFANGQADLCLQQISALSLESLDYKVDEVLLTHLKKEFVIMGYSTVCTYAEKWSGLILQNSAGNRYAATFNTFSY